jgi:hypothetical protein
MVRNASRAASGGSPRPPAVPLVASPRGPHLRWPATASASTTGAKPGRDTRAAPPGTASSLRGTSTAGAASAAPPTRPSSGRHERLLPAAVRLGQSGTAATGVCVSVSGETLDVNAGMPGRSGHQRCFLSCPANQPAVRRLSAGSWAQALQMTTRQDDLSGLWTNSTRAPTDTSRIYTHCGGPAQEICSDIVGVILGFVQRMRRL